MYRNKTLNGEINESNSNIENAPTNNNNSGSSGKPNKQTASAYDTDFATRLATT